MAKTKINKVFIIGTVEEVDTKIGVTSDSREYISGKVVVKTIINGIENLIDVRLFAMKLTKEGAESKLFQSYNKLDGMIKKRIKINGELHEEAMIKADGTINKFNSIALKFYSEPKKEEADTATFEYSGFVTKALYERKKKNDQGDEEIAGYRIEIAQANYNDTKMQIIKFDIDKNDINIANAIENNYLVGYTVSINGTISFISHVETKIEEVAFGEPTAKTFVTSEKIYKITGGKEAFAEDDESAYSSEEIKKLVESYKEEDVKRLAAQKSKVEESSNLSAVKPASAPAAKMSRVTSLI